MRKQVLIIDDDSRSLVVLQDYLQSIGFEVLQATSSADALVIMRGATPPQLVIANWTMPVMDGPALCRALRAERSMPFCYIIILTSRSDSTQVMKALAAGADDFLTKPARPDEMAARLRLAQRIIDLEADVEAMTRDRHPWVVHN
jgi:DNA-binding response OmpR family regulator